MSGFNLPPGVSARDIPGNEAEPGPEELNWNHVADTLPGVGGTYIVGGWHSSPRVFDWAPCSLRVLEGRFPMWEPVKPLPFEIEYWLELPPVPGFGAASRAPGAPRHQDAAARECDYPKCSKACGKSTGYCHKSTAPAAAPTAPVSATRWPTVDVQSAWEWAGQSPDIKATAEDLRRALTEMRAILASIAGLRPAAWRFRQKAEAAEYMRRWPNSDCDHLWHYTWQPQQPAPHLDVQSLVVLDDLVAGAARPARDATIAAVPPPVDVELAAIKLVAAAERQGLLLTIEQVPIHPDVLGMYSAAVRVTPARRPSGG